MPLTTYYLSWSVMNVMREEMMGGSIIPGEKFYCESGQKDPEEQLFTQRQCV